MTAEARYGVRFREPDEMRRAALLVGIIFVVFGLSSGLLQLIQRDVIAHPDAHLLLLILTAVFGVAVCAVGLAADRPLVARLWPPFTGTLFLASIVAAPLVLFLIGYPNSGIAAISYPIIAILAFYLLVRWLAFAFVAVLIVGHGVMELFSNVPWPTWVTLVFVTAALLTAGYLTGDLIEQLKRSRDAEHRTAAELADLNANLESKVAEQVEEVERLGRLRRFLSAPVAEAVLTSSYESKLAPHRREIAVLFCDLRGFTAFTNAAEPEEVVGVLDEYYRAVGEMLQRYDATIGGYAGDGIMAYFGDPVVREDPALDAVQMASELREPMNKLVDAWTRRGYDLSYGIGLAHGYATLGVVGFDGRYDYTPVGAVVNLAARLCSQASAAQVLLDHATHAATSHRVASQHYADVDLKGYGKAARSYALT